MILILIIYGAAASFLFVYSLVQSSLLYKYIFKKKNITNHTKLSDDFIPLITTFNTIYAYKSISAMEDYNILYVALTRAKKNLIINKEIYAYLKIKKGHRSYSYTDGICTSCKKEIIIKKYEEGINCIGFNSKPLYSIKHKCGCTS